MKDYLKRVSDEVIERHLKSSGAVLIEGPKWCGKTTSAMQFSKTNHIKGLKLLKKCA